MKPSAPDLPHRDALPHRTHGPRRRPPVGIAIALASATPALAFAWSVALALAPDHRHADIVRAAPLAQPAACTASGWQQVPLPNGFVAQSLAVDAAPGRQRLYAGTYRASAAAGIGSATVQVIDLSSLATAPVAAFDPRTMNVIGLAVRPDSGQLAAGMSGTGVVHANPDGTLRAVLLEGRLARAVETANGTTFAGATDRNNPAVAGLEPERAAIWRQRGDEPWTSLTGDVERFDGYFWDLALDRQGRLWAAMDHNGLFTIANAATDTPGGWAPVGDLSMRGRTAQSIAVDPADARVLYAGLRESATGQGTNPAGTYGLRISRDGGNTFTGYPASGTTGEIFGGGTPFRASFVASVATGPSGGWVWASVWGLGVFVSNDAGSQWHRLRLPAGTGPGYQIEPYFDVLATARIDGACDVLFAASKDGMWARNIAGIAAEMANTIFLPRTYGAPWDIRPKVE